MNKPLNSVEASSLKNSRPPVTRILAEYVSGLSYDKLPAEVIHHARLAIADTIAVGIAAANEDVSKFVTQIALSETGGSAIWGTNKTAGATSAALANGTLAHAHDYDDNNKAMVGHPSAPVLPAVLALAEETKAGGDEILTSFLAGVELEGRLGRAVTYEHNGLGWHTTGTLGTLGATAAAARLLRLDPVAVQNALGIATSMASGTRQNFGTMTKPLHVGLAARNGVLAAKLAQVGVNASPLAIEGHEGFFDLYTSEEVVNCDAAISDLGTRFEIFQNTPKVHASCALVHTAVDIVIDALNSGKINPDHIDEIECGVSYHALNLMRYGVPKDHLEARFSIPYCVAAAIVSGKLGIREFSENVVADRRILDLAGRVKVHILPEFSTKELFADAYLSGNVYTTVKVKHKRGKVFEDRKLRQKGHPLEPMSDQDFHDKFIECLATFNGPKRPEEMWSSFMALGEENLDLGMLRSAT